VAPEQAVNPFATLQEVRQAAELLGLERSNLYRKMKALGIAPKESL
jgi:transcriptional regulator of acetoin/glycerol metabolism